MKKIVVIIAVLAVMVSTVIFVGAGGREPKSYEKDGYLVTEWSYEEKLPLSAREQYKKYEPSFLDIKDGSVIELILEGTVPLKYHGERIGTEYKTDSFNMDLLPKGAILKEVAGTEEMVDLWYVAEDGFEVWFSIHSNGVYNYCIYNPYEDLGIVYANDSLTAIYNFRKGTTEVITEEHLRELEEQWEKENSGSGIIIRGDD